MRALLCAALVLRAVPALAETSDADRATARALAAEGHDALQKKDFETAEDRFRRADSLVHAPTLVVDHARALVGLNRIADAYRRYDRVVREGVAPNAPWAWKRALKDAQREIELLKPKLAWLTVRVKGPSEAEVTIDGEPVPAEEIGTQRAVDPGQRVVRATAAGFEAREGTLELDAGKNAELELELIPVKPEPEPVVEAPPPVRKPPPKPVEQKDHTLTYVAFGVGGAGIATGVVTGILALGTRSDLLASCPDLKCTPDNADQQRRMEDDADRYRMLGTISGIGFGVGIAGAAAGLALLLTDQSEEPSTGSAWVPYVEPSSVGVRGRF